jgi:16S rRNA G966 N2-methylase RsmD
LAQLERDWGRVLDLYSGTGSIGIEALSRGAVWADFVEINAGVCRIITENLEHTNMTDRARVNNRNVSSFLNAPPATVKDGKKRSAGGLHRRKGGEHRDAKILVAAENHNQSVTEESPQNELEDFQAVREYDIIFLDPPYADPKIPETIRHVARSGLIKPGGLVVIGHTPRLTLADSYGNEITADEEDQQVENENPKPTERMVLNRIRFRQHGDSAFSIYYAGEPPSFLVHED